MSAQSLSPSLHSPYHGLCTVPIPSSPQSLSRHLHSPYHGLCIVPIPSSPHSLSRLLHSPFRGLCTVPIPSSSQSVSRNPHSPCHGLYTVHTTIRTSSSLCLYTAAIMVSTHSLRRLFILPVASLSNTWPSLERTSAVLHLITTK